jgi:hypothetical protein
MTHLLKLWGVNAAWRIVLVALLLGSSAHRLPAPIVETPEQPTPAPEESALAPRPKHSARSRPKIQQDEATVKQPASASTTRSKTQVPTSSSRFAGVWTGTISVGILGTANETLAINSTGTIVREKNQFGAATHQATCDGTTVKFRAGAFGEIAFTFTPNADGQTAVASANSIFISNPSVTFQKTPNSEVAAASLTVPAHPESPTATPASPQTTGFPTAVPVPNKPGFVYNPFDPTKKHILDVRGIPAGTKVTIPATGKQFVVP